MPLFVPFSAIFDQKSDVDAWNVYDAKAFAAPFAENAVFIHIYGGQLDGRAAIEEGHRFIFHGV